MHIPSDGLKIVNEHGLARSYARPPRKSCCLPIICLGTFLRCERSSYVASHPSSLWVCIGRESR